jgi:hypothetical protein
MADLSSLFPWQGNVIKLSWEKMADEMERRPGDKSPGYKVKGP